jgi:hypothetical protein
MDGVLRSITREAKPFDEPNAGWRPRRLSLTLGLRVKHDRSAITCYTACR